MCFSIHVSKFIFFPHSARNIHLPLREIRIIKSKMHTRKRVNFQLWLQKFYFWVPTNRIVLTILWVSESGLPNWFYSFAANHRINNARGGDREIPDMQKGEEPSSSSPSGTQKGRDKKKKKKKTRVKGSVATVLNIYSSLSPWGRCEKPDNSHVCL